MLITSVILLCFLGVYSGIVLWLRPAIRQQESHNNPRVEPRVSILIAVHNEAGPLPALFDCLAALDYPPDKLQILIIDDRSTDNTPDLVRSFIANHPQAQYLCSTNLHNWRSSKKAALALGVEHATGDILLYTDADCTPPPSWVRAMTSRFCPDTGMVAGFSPQRAPRPGCWDNFLVTDSLAAAIIAAAGMERQRGITCTGRNLAIRKGALIDSGGYAALPDTLSGDDDFILQAITRHPDWRTRYMLAPEGKVLAKGPANWRQFIRQKTRHISAGVQFTRSQQTGYTLYHGANLGIWIGALFSPIHTLFVLPLLIKFIIDIQVQHKFSRVLGVRFSVSGWLLWEFLFPLYHLATAPRAFFSKPEW